MNRAILPLAITMLVGPQIMSAIIFITSTRPVRTSAAFITGVAIAATVGVLIAITVASLLDINLLLGDSSDNGSAGHIVQYLLVTRLDERAQLARKHHRLRCVHSPDPLMEVLRASGVHLRAVHPP